MNDFNDLLLFIFHLFDFLSEDFSPLAEEFESKRKPTQRRWSVDLALKKLLAEKRGAEKWKQMFGWSALNTDVCWSRSGQDDGQSHKDQHRLSPRIDLKWTWRAVASISVAAAIHIECRSTKVVTRLCTLTNACFVHVNTTGWNITSHFLQKWSMKKCEKISGGAIYHAGTRTRIVGETIQIGRFRTAARERRRVRSKDEENYWPVLTNVAHKSIGRLWNRSVQKRLSQSFVRSLSYQEQWSALEISSKVAQSTSYFTPWNVEESGCFVRVFTADASFSSLVPNPFYGRRFINLLCLIARQ